MSFLYRSNGDQREPWGLILGSIVVLSALFAGLPLGLQQVDAQSNPTQTAPPADSVEPSPTEQPGTEGQDEPEATSTPTPNPGPVEVTDFDPRSRLRHGGTGVG